MATRPKTTKVSNEGQMPRKLATKATSGSPSSRYQSGQSIPTNPNFLNNPVLAYRYSTNVVQLVRNLAHIDGVVSAAIMSEVQVANSGYRVGAYSMVDGRFDPQATLLAQSLMAAMDTMHDYTKGYSAKRSMDTTTVQALRETMIAGGLAMEMVLNKDQLPDRFQIIDYSTLRMESRGDGTSFPTQPNPSGGEAIKLNIPNFFVSELMRDADRVYGDSLLEAAANMSIYFNEFIEDVRRVVHVSGHPRTVAILDSEKIIAAATKQGKKGKEIQTFMDEVQESVRSMLEGLEPQEAIVTYDAAKFENLTAEGEKSDYTPLISTIANMLSTSLKSHPSILGLRGQGSQSLSNTESLVFLKNVRAIQVPVEECFSRALTLACRLYYHDVYVEYTFKPVNLRPELELQTFRTQALQNDMELLSLGLITDDEFAWRHDMFPLPAGYKKLSGTLFRHGAGATTKIPKENRDKPGPQEKALESDQPDSNGGADNEEEE